jgi:hypothetical protein
MAKVVLEEGLDKETKSLLARHQAGENLAYLVTLPGWQDALHILQTYIDAAEKELVTYRDSDAQHSLRLLAELQGKKDALAHLEKIVKARIALVNAPPDAISKYVSTI